MDDLSESLNSSVGFLYKTMLERDPRKRRVKPVQPHLLQLDFTGLDNSSDDSDFKVGDASDDDDDGDGDEDEDEEEDDDAEESDVDRQRGKDDKASVASSSDSSVCPKSPIVQLDKIVTNIDKIQLETASHNMPMKKLKVSVCCVCLGDSSAQENEIVECDSCGASVHEGCYGITEVASVGSSASSASTEPWFCDSCKAGIKPRCELCPNSGGIFKETDAGRWVHLVCALYIPGVAFGDVDKLSMVTLFEMSYTKWGSKECCLCDDEQFARTGVCIGCDAGLCRSYFHVTCAQKQGMLTEASPDEEIADPFFAYCRQHADKALVRVKRRNWLAVQSNMKNFESRLSEKEKLRVQKKLTVHQQTFAAEKERQYATAWVPTVKMPRLLQTSFYAVSQLLKKAELLGHAHPQAEPGGDVRKKSHFPPMLSSDFAGYYNDRNVRITNLKERIQDLKVQKEKLQAQETHLHCRYELLMKEIAHLESTGSKHQTDGELLWNILTMYSQKRLRWAGAIHFQSLPKSSPKKTVVAALPGFLQRCDVCEKTHDQHLMAKCDNCFKYLHLGCLDPPLTRMPKKTKQQGWQCSRCISPNSSDAEVPDIDTNEPRRLRDKVHDPMKYTSLFRDQRWPRKPAIKRPRPVPVVPEDNGDLCKDCRGVTDPNNCVKCDNCCRSQHLSCLNPPRTRTPRVRGYVWFCDDCQRTVNSSTDLLVKEKQLSPGQPQPVDVNSVGHAHPVNRSPSKSKSPPSNSGSPKKKRLSPAQEPGASPGSTVTEASTLLPVKHVRRVGVKRPKFALSTTSRSKHQKDVGKISSNIVRRALASGRRLGKPSTEEGSLSVKRPKKSTACRLKVAVEKEFFYSSRNDPMRRPGSVMSASSKVTNVLSDDESIG